MQNKTIRYKQCLLDTMKIQTAIMQYTPYSIAFSIFGTWKMSFSPFKNRYTKFFPDTF